MNFIQVVSRKLVKPSSPTPHNRRQLKISVIDQLVPPVYPPTIYYYLTDASSHDRSAQNDHERINSLEKSLSDTLTLFYPLAGRFIKDSLLIDCNDQGVEYLQAQVDGQLAEFLHGEPDIEVLNHFVPFIAESDTSPLVLIQITMFECGGIVIGTRISHRIGDGFTFTAFINGWAAACRGGIKQVISPCFEAASNYLPARDLSWVKPRPSKNKGAKFVTKRFMFDGTAILSLKAKAKAKSGASGSRVDVVMTFIWRALICVAKAKHGHLRPSLISQPMNLRGKLFSSMPENCCGNLYMQSSARFMGDEKKMELRDLVSLLRHAKRNTIGLCEKMRDVDDDDGILMVINSFKELHEELYNDEVDVYSIASLCGFPLYEADFGWGKPIWVGRASALAEVVVLMDTKCGTGIEAWVSLDEKDLLQFQFHLVREIGVKMNNCNFNFNSVRIENVSKL